MCDSNKLGLILKEEVLDNLRGIIQFDVTRAIKETAL
jgi:hypothetical protein